MTAFDWNAFFQTLASNFAGILTPIVIGYTIVWVRGHIKDKTAADNITQALTNAPGAVQQAVQAGKNIADAKQAGVDYVKAVAAADIAREPEKNTDAILAERVGARLGNENIATNLAIAASPQPENPHPLAAVPLVPVHVVGDKP
jgi:hypothetical protein